MQRGRERKDNRKGENSVVFLFRIFSSPEYSLLQNILILSEGTFGLIYSFSSLTTVGNLIRSVRITEGRKGERERGRERGRGEES